MENFRKIPRNEKYGFQIQRKNQVPSLMKSDSHKDTGSWISEYWF